MGPGSENACRPGGLSRVRRLAVAFVVIVALSGCARFRPPLEQKTSHGPTARQFWLLKQMVSNEREPSMDERRHWEDQLDQRISQYLRENPEAPNARHASAFRFDNQFVPGMTKEQ